MSESEFEKAKASFIDKEKSWNYNLTTRSDLRCFNAGADWAYEWLENECLFSKVALEKTVKLQQLQVQAEALAEAMLELEGKVIADGQYIREDALARWREFKGEVII